MFVFKIYAKRQQMHVRQKMFQVRKLYMQKKSRKYYFKKLCKKKYAEKGKGGCVCVITAVEKSLCLSLPTSVSWEASKL